ncbi:MAG: aspartate kinase [Clostridia bacterium]|nr:aspartate kinase [Clostridia bacterium]
MLEELCRLLSGVSLIKELSLRTRDYLVSFGERLAVRIIAAYLSQTGIKAKAFDAWDIGFTSNSNFTDSEILDETYHRINDSLGNLGSDYVYTPLITGFIAKDVNGNITTLGRGGSDLTASVLGAALNVDEIQVWKDVDGILTTDPRIVSSAKPVKNVSFEEASELVKYSYRSCSPGICRGKDLLCSISLV